MKSSMWRKGAQPLSLILLLVVICARAAPLEEQQTRAQEHEHDKDLTTIKTTLEEKQPQSQDHIDCKLTFDATMDSLDDQQLQALQLQDNGCNVLRTGSSSSSPNKPADTDKPVSVVRQSSPGNSSSQPLYELQLVVWPSDVEDGDDFLPTAATTPPKSTTTRRTTKIPVTTKSTTRATRRPAGRPTRRPTTKSPSPLPSYEDQLAVFPQMDVEEENFDYVFGELQPVASTQRPWASSTTPKPTYTSSWEPAEKVYILENYHIKYGNGKEEYKLVLSNGLVNYMKLYVKRVGKDLINVQEGYYSVPVDGKKSKIRIIHYIADEHGYKVYKMEDGALKKVLPTRGPVKATESPESMPVV
ncbi:GH12248 [Drosophila grimshawi]|uniref:GH12248 n=1 Tax=Drosophila grimshawi TaxID=7222 RepID=B4JJI9_DROGR|nr:GH12248 [Drosophila grimshawi]